MPRKKADKKVSSTKSSDSNVTDTSESCTQSESSNKSEILLSDNSCSDKSNTSKGKKTKIKAKAKAKTKAKPRKKTKSKKKDDYVIIKADPEELKKSLSYNITEKAKLTKSEYDNQFNELREQYVAMCKDFHKIQIQLKKKDSEREEILNKIRELQRNNSDIVINELNFDNMSNEDKDKDKEKLTNKEKKSSKSKGKAKGSVNLIDRYKKKGKNNIILKPLRDTDMETDDSESEELSASESSDSESD